MLAFGTFLVNFDFLQIRGKLFQRLLVQYGKVAEVVGPLISCVRMVYPVSSGRPTLYTDLWKIATGRNIIDNFANGRYGNLLAGLD